jgi:DNA primase
VLFRSRKTPPTAQEKAQAIAVLLETVARQPDEILKSEWVKALATRFGVAEDSVMKQLKKAPGPDRRETRREEKRAPSPAMPAIERGFIQLLLGDPALIEQAAALRPEDLSSPLARELFSAILALPPEARAKAPTALAERCPEHAPLIMELAVTDIGGEGDGRQGAAGAMRMLKRFSLERRWKEMKGRLASLTPAEMEEFRKVTADLKTTKEI